MSKYIQLLLLANLIISCDPSYRADIINQSDKQITLIFKYDEKSTSTNFERKIGFIPNLIDDNEGSKIIFKSDTINFIITAHVQPNDTLFMEMGIGTHPNFKNIDKIIIYSADTVILDTKYEMLNAFDENYRYQYELIIK
ncbi:MAG: hypothetical protein KDD31_01800 [Muricauda sp.]|nr:hypothetical protein [Allomuricauda sp.]